MITFTGKTVLITGAAGGIGHAVAKKMAAAGAEVAISEVSLDAVEAVQREIGATGTVSAYRTDVSDEQSCKQTAADVAQRYGKIDHLVHCAGIYPEKLVADMTQNDWRQLMSINLDGNFNICKTVINYLAAHRQRKSAV